MAKAKSKSTSKTKRKIKPDGFVLYVPLVDYEGRDLPVLNTANHLICFTDKSRFEQWRDHYQIPVSKIKRYQNVSSIPRMFKMMKAGKRPRGICINTNPHSLNQYASAFKSKVNDLSFADDIEHIATLVKNITVETKDVPLEIA